jgi:hypothetical protein
MPMDMPTHDPGNKEQKEKMRLESHPNLSKAEVLI